MATVKFYAPGDMRNFDWTVWKDGELETPVRDSGIHVRSGTLDVAYYGSFEYDYFKHPKEIGTHFLGVSGGTLNQLFGYEAQLITHSIEDFSFDAVAAFHYMRLGDLDSKYNIELLEHILDADDVVIGSYFDDVLMGFDGHDVINGGARNDSLYGGAGDDVLKGGDGNDKLQGGAALDSLLGGRGHDAFIFKNRSEFGDTIRDFHSEGASGDAVLLRSTLVGGLTEGPISNAQFQSGDGSNATTKDVRFVYDEGTGELYFDANGSGSGGKLLIAILQGAPDLQSDDILIV